MSQESLRTKAEQAREQVDALKRKVEAALSQVDFVIGYGKGYDALNPTPIFIRSKKELDSLIWDDFCIHNLATYVPPQKRPGGLFKPDEKVGVIVKGCDSRTIIELLQEGIIDREHVKIVGVSCQGKIDVKKLGGKVLVDRVEKVTVGTDSVAVTVDAKEESFSIRELLHAKCLSCEYPTPLIHDHLVEGPRREKNERLDSPYQPIEQFEVKTAGERFAYWEEQFSRCLRCYACRDICPLCYCQFECIAQTRIPHWVSQRAVAKDSKFFHMFRAMHLAGRCTECGECERACPVDIPLLLLHKKINHVTLNLFDYKAGINPQAKPPLLTFSLDEQKITEETWD